MALEADLSRSERMARWLVAQSPAMQAVRSAIAEAAETSMPVVLEGEQGVGKEFVARLIHLRSARSRRSFETLAPPSLPADLAADELFGDQSRKLRHAAGGTLLIKDVWRFPSSARRHLSLALSHSRPRDTTPMEVHDVWLMLSSRVVLDIEGEQRSLAAVEEALPAGVGAGYRRIAVPPLRRRPADIPLLVDTFSREHAAETRRDPLRFSPQAMDRLTRHGWPGNVSELKGVVFLLYGAISGPVVNEGHLDGLIPAVEDELPIARFGLEELVRAKLRTFLGRIRGYHVEDLHSHVINQVERPLIELVLEQTRGNQLQAARILGINRNTLRKKIRALSIRQ